MGKNIMYEVQYLTPNDEWRQYGKRHDVYKNAYEEAAAAERNGIYKGVRIVEIEETREVVAEWMRG